MAIKEYENKQIRLNTPLRGNAAGTTVSVKCDRKGTPLDQYWRRRLKDANTDKCVEIVTKKKEGGKG